MPSTDKPMPAGAAVSVAVISAFGPHALGAIITGPEADAILASEHVLHVVRLHAHYDVRLTLPDAAVAATTPKEA